MSNDQPIQAYVAPEPGQTIWAQGLIGSKGTVLAVSDQTIFVKDEGGRCIQVASEPSAFFYSERDMLNDRLLQILERRIAITQEELSLLYESKQLHARLEEMLPEGDEN